MFDNYIPSLILFTEAEGSAYQIAFAKAAKGLKGELLFVTSGVTEEI